MLKIFLISIVIVPVLLGVKAGSIRSSSRGLRLLIAGWWLYGLLWFVALYIINARWVG